MTWRFRLLAARIFSAITKCEQSGPVLYIATEGIHADSRDRLNALALGKGLDPAKDLGSLTLMWRQPGVLLDSESFMGPLREIASRYLLIIVDVLSGAWSGNENEAAEIVPLYRKIQGVIRIGPTVLLLHHNVKPTAETIARKAGFNIRGSSALYGGLDDSISLSQVKDSPKSLVTVETRAGRPVGKFEVSWPGTDG